ncbi:hypothetical protein GQ55_3G196500 [Panicum hallii var. hallii]|uniref:Uncharacterized protein n=1 Tax=Panicum hallii var. hallii TaxID=1504633 RepID=A0A2T7EB95_9POAL|nr:hypothetical protein GQ55_3G196500 [Panicum hallii var. hallii]
MTSARTTRSAPSLPPTTRRDPRPPPAPRRARPVARTLRFASGGHAAHGRSHSRRPRHGARQSRIAPGGRRPAPGTASRGRAAPGRACRSLSGRAAASLSHARGLARLRRGRSLHARAAGAALTSHASAGPQLARAGCRSRARHASLGSRSLARTGCWRRTQLRRRWRGGPAAHLALRQVLRLPHEA